MLASSWRHRGLLGALVVTSAVVTALIVTLGGLLDRQADDGVRGEFAGRSGDELALRLSLALASDAEGQDSGVRSAAERDFAAVEVDIVIDRIVEGRVQLSAEASDGTKFTEPAEALSVPEFAERADLVAGDWADASGVTMQADAAAALRLEPGAVVELDGVPFELTGTWRIRDPLDPRWTNSQLMSEGSAGDRAAVVMIDEAQWGRINAEPQATWSIVPNVRTLTAADLSTIRPVWFLLSGALRDSLVGLEDLERGGEFIGVAAEVEARVAGLTAVEPVVLLLIGALGLATLGQLARLLALERQVEMRLLWSRGSSGGAFAGRAAVEAFAGGALGSALGTGLAFAALWADGVVDGDSAFAEVALPGALVAMTASVFAGASVWSYVRQLDADRSEPSPRRASATRVGLPVLVGAAAVVSTWQLLLYGSPLTTDTRGDLSVDPVTVAAPALVLIASVLVAAALAPLIGGLLDRPRGTSSVVRRLALSTVARRPEAGTASIVTSALAVATILLAAGYSGSWSLAFDRSAQSRAGAEALATAPTGITAQTVDLIAALPVVAGTAIVHLRDVQVDAEEVSLVAVTPDALRDLVAPLALANSSAVAEGLRAEIPGPVLPPNSKRIELTVAATGFAADPASTLLISDAYGVLREVGLTVTSSVIGTSGAVIEYAATIPLPLQNAPTPLQVLAVVAEIAAGAVAPGTIATWDMQSLRTTADAGTSDVELGPSWAPVSLDPESLPPDSRPIGLGFEVDATARTVRLAPPLAMNASVRVAISQALADRVGVSVGDTIGLRGLGSGSGPMSVVVAEIVEAVPSAADEMAVLMDLGVVRNLEMGAPAAIPAPRQLWLSASDAVAAGEAARLLLPAGSRIEDATEPAIRSALGAAVTALWITAAGASLLALVILAISVRAQRNQRRGEVAILRALGLGARDQGAIRRHETASTIAAGVLGGSAAGAAVILLTLGPFARSAIPAGSPVIATPLAFDAVGGGIALLTIVLGLAAIAVVAAAQVAGDARSAGSGELDQ